MANPVGDVHSCSLQLCTSRAHDSALCTYHGGLVAVTLIGPHTLPSGHHVLSTAITGSRYQASFCQRPRGNMEPLCDLGL